MRKKFQSVGIRLATYFIAVYMFVGAVAHVVKPEFFSPMIPAPIPEWLANGFAFVAEFSIAVMMLLPKYRHWGGLAFLVLCFGFMPLHIWDFFRPDPMVGEHPMPTIRLIVQCLYMYMGFSIWKYYKPINKT